MASQMIDNVTYFDFDELWNGGYLDSFYDEINHIDEDVNILDADTMCNMISDTWKSYMVCFEPDNKGTISDLFLSIFREHYPYYKELILTYKKEFDYQQGIIKTTTSSGESKDKHSDLPNKKVEGDDIYSYPTSADANNTSGIVTSTDNSKMLSLRRQYLSQIRNIIREYARRFSDCFFHIF